MQLAKKDLFVGISSGATMFAALQVTTKPKRKMISFIMPDTGKRYLTMDLFNSK